ncbi:hypothetical protein ACVILK_006875 [Bradyrhizobium embrapense]
MTENGRAPLFSRTAISPRNLPRSRPNSLKRASFSSSTGTRENEADFASPGHLALYHGERFLHWIRLASGDGAELRVSELVSVSLKNLAPYAMIATGFVMVLAGLIARSRQKRFEAELEKTEPRPPGQKPLKKVAPVPRSSNAKTIDAD